jgi:hypothetical protein
MIKKSLKIYLTAIQCHSIDKIIRVVMSTTAIFNFLSFFDELTFYLVSNIKRVHESRDDITSS